MISNVGQQISLDLAQIKNDIAHRANEAAIMPSATEPDAAQPVGFADVMKAAIHSTNNKDQVANDKMAEVDSGKSDDLVGAMLASQEASLSFSMLMQVRNKVVGAMDDLIKMQL